MKRTFSLIGVLAMLLWVVSCGRENSSPLTAPEMSKPAASQLANGSAQSYSDYAGVAAPEISTVAPNQQVTVKVPGNLRYYTSSSSFGLTCELERADFEGTNLPPNRVKAVFGAFNSNTDNECFSPGAIPDGISLASFFSKNMVVLTRGFLGMPSTVVGPNAFSDNLTIHFEPGEVNAVGMELLDPFGPATLDLVIIGQSDAILGVFTVTTGTTTGTFFGVISPFEAISRLYFIQFAGDGGELVDNVRYGWCSIGD